MYSLVYISSATQGFSSQHLRELVERARFNNARHGITGLLLHRGGCFLQRIEGRQQFVTDLFRRIAHDHRHTGLQVLMTENGSERLFPDWSLAWRDLNDPELLADAGFRSLAEPEKAGREYFSNPARAHRLLQWFEHHGYGRPHHEHQRTA